MGFFFAAFSRTPLIIQNARGSFSFSGFLTSELNADGQPVKGTGFDLADYLLGLPQSTALKYGAETDYYRGWATGWYVQDDRRPSRGLSFNRGLRYEYFSPYTELNNHLTNLILNPQHDGRNGCDARRNPDNLPTSFVRPDTQAFSPRLGFAWRPGAKRDMVVRGGYSIFYTAPLIRRLPPS